MLGFWPTMFGIEDEANPATGGTAEGKVDEL